MNRRWFGGLILVVVLGVFGYALVDDATSRPMAVAGDQLGQDPGESFSNYRNRAAATLDDAESGENVFALVTFSEPLTAGRAGELLDEVERVNTMIVGMSHPTALPEPVGSATRADVFSHHFDLIADSLDGIGEVPAPYQLTAVTAWDDPEVFRVLGDAEEVAAVEVLPPDAMWGNFGIRPAAPPGIDMMDVAVPPRR